MSLRALCGCFRGGYMKMFGGAIGAIHESKLCVTDWLFLDLPGISETGCDLERAWENTLYGRLTLLPFCLSRFIIIV